jgi:hypothetical protein
MLLAKIAFDTFYLVESLFACLLSEKIEGVTLFEHGIYVDALENV